MKALVLFTTSLCLSPALLANTQPQQVVEHYNTLAHAVYEDALISARSLQGSIEQLLQQPSEANLRGARAAWRAARVPYQQSEAFRFANAIVDDWEGKLNAWPLDEGLIDYVDSSVYGEESDENPFYSANIIANPQLKLAGVEVDASSISPALIAETLQELDEIETNVASGYHAIEFLLWGQDLNGTGPGAGQRPASDFDPDNCSHGHCQRRADYLRAVTQLLVDDLAWMSAQWDVNGAARQQVLAKDHEAAINDILTGLGSLSYGELAGERMKLGVMLHDPEEEHDCFSDNTHWSHYYDAKGIYNVYSGHYTRIDGSKLSGPSLSALVASHDSAVDAELSGQLQNTLQRMQALVDSAENQGVAYDQLLAAGNTPGNQLVLAAVEALVQQTKGIEKAVNALKLKAQTIEGSDSLTKVFE